MELQRLHYTVTAEVKFTDEEIDFLIGRAKTHYDWTCQAAGLSIAEGGQTNGFIAQLKLFPTLAAVWTFRELDLTLKVLEMRDFNNELLRTKLFTQIILICDGMSRRHKEMNKEN